MIKALRFVLQNVEMAFYLDQSFVMTEMKAILQNVTLIVQEMYQVGIAQGGTKHHHQFV